LLCKTFSNLLLAAPLITGCQRPLLPHLLKLISLVFPFFYWCLYQQFVFANKRWTSRNSSILFAG
jgi:hypothetical protein